MVDCQPRCQLSVDRVSTEVSIKYQKYWLRVVMNTWLGMSLVHMIPISLGAYINQNLWWSELVKEAAKVISSVIGALKTWVRPFTCEAAAILLHTWELLSNHINFHDCCPVWCRLDNGLANKINKKELKNCTIRVFNKSAYHSSAIALCCKLGWDNLYIRRRKFKLKWLFIFRL